MLTPQPDESARDARRIRHRGKLILVATLAVQTLVTMGGLSLATVAPMAATALGIEASMIGYQLSLIYGVAIISSLAAGGFIQRFGACRTSQIAMLGTFVGGGLCGVASLPFIVAGSLAFGLAQGLVNPAASHLLVRHSPTQNRSMIFAIKQTGQPLGAFLAGIVCPPVALLLGWHMAPVVAALCALGTAILLQPACRGWDGDPGSGKRRSTASTQTGPWNGLRLVLSRPDLRLLAAASFCYVFVQLSLTGYMVSLLVAERGFDLVTAGFVLAVMQVAGIGGRILWGWVIDRRGDGLLILCGLGLIMAAGVVAIMLLPQESPRLVLYGIMLLLGVSAVGWTGVYISEVARLAPPDAVGAATGASLSVTFFGVLVGPTMFAFMQPLLGGYSPTLALLVVMSLAGTFAAIGARRAAKHQA